MLVTSLFILFADLIPKRMAMMAPERIATHIVAPMLFCVAIFKPLVWIFNGLANTLFRRSSCRPRIKKWSRRMIFTPWCQLVRKRGCCGSRNIIWSKMYSSWPENCPVDHDFTWQHRLFWSARNRRNIKKIIAEQPHSKFLVCDGNIDTVAGYVDSKDILLHVLNEKPILLTDGKFIQAPCLFRIRWPRRCRALKAQEKILR